MVYNKIYTILTT